jgi:hypothetical protein
VRTPIFVRTERFDLESISSDIESVRRCFDSYLESYPVKSSRSKHSLMGPVGKILQEVKSGRWDADSLAGYALNIHLANPKAKGFISQEARNSLTEGIDRLLTLLKSSPVTVHDKILDRIDYGLYFMRRAKAMEAFENLRQEFATFLRHKYGTSEKLAEAWGEKSADYGLDFSRVPYPGRKIFEKATGRKKADISEFARQAELKGYELIDEEEEI